MTVEDMRVKRVCPRCRYEIWPGWWHKEQPQPEGSNVVVCDLQRANGVSLRGPLVEVISQFLNEEGDRG